MILLSLALTALCLARTRLILLAPALAVLALWIATREPRPDVFVDGEARTVAVRGADGALAVMGDRTSGLADRFAVEQWLSADGDRARAGSKEVTAAAACDPLGCTLPLADGGLVALSRIPDLLEDDCRLARVLVTTHAPPADCGATVILVDPRQPTGAMAGLSDGGGICGSSPPRRPMVAGPGSRRRGTVATDATAASPGAVGPAQVGKATDVRATGKPRDPFDDITGESTSEPSR